MTPLHPVVVTGSPRSGKTVVCRILAQSREFAYVEEPLALWNTGIKPSGDDCRGAAEATDAIQEAIRIGCQKAIGNRGRYVDDLAYHALRIPFLAQVLPGMKVIHVVRRAEAALPEMVYGWTYQDTVGKVVARRYKNLRLGAIPRLAVRFGKNYLTSRFRGRRLTWGPRVPGMAGFAKTHSVAETAAYQWATINQIAADDLSVWPEHQWMRVRHEDLVADPVGVTSGIAAFVESKNPDKMTRIAREYVQPDFPFEKRVEIDPQTWPAIRHIVAPIQQRMGYWDTDTPAGGHSESE